MEENIETLKEFHRLQLEMFKKIMSLSDLDEVDMAIEDFNEGFVETVKVINSIKIDEKENFDKLMSLAWSIKVNELVEDVFNA